MEEVKIVRSKRKTLSLQVTKDSVVVVRAPLRTPDTFIRSFVSKHADWIEKKKEEMAARHVLKRRFASGETFLYLGNTYELARERHFAQGRSKLKIFDDVFFLDPKVKNPKKVFEEWYKKQAHETIIPRVRELGAAYKLSFNTLRITSATTRWGSCSGKRNLSFSWRLMMAPREVIDYVILHELTHLTHMNHSQRFWNALEQICPQYRAHKKWLSDTAASTRW